MGPDLEIEGRSEMVIEGSIDKVKENESVLGESQGKHMKCESNYEDKSFEMEEDEHRGEDAEVNIVEFEKAVVVGECQDATETQTESSSSTSFSDSVSGLQNGSMSADDEVVSQLPHELSRPRKKKVTSHWRTFVYPLMGRCKWTEMQIKRCQFQALNYDTLLAENPRKKHFKLENFKLEDFGAKSLPFSDHVEKDKIMKRKKRKRVEDTKDTAAYMSQHYLFSYYENRRSNADAAFMDDDWGNLVISTDKNMNGNDEFGDTDELFLSEFRDGDNSLEQILSKITVVQSQVSDLKTRVNKVLSENAGKFCSNGKLSVLVPCNDALTSSMPRNTASPPNNGDRMPVGSSSYIAPKLVVPEYSMGDPVLPESAVSSHEEVTHLPDMMIESTDQPRVGGLCKNTEDGILIYNRRAKEELNKDGILISNRKAKEELNNFEEVKIEPIEKLQLAKEEQRSTTPPVPVMEDLLTDDQPTLKIRSIAKLTAPKNKRKRGRRKPGSGIWSKRSSG